MVPGYLFGFDYLRDQIRIREIEELILGRDVLQLINGRTIDSQLAQMEHRSIIVDEADSVLIDESTTPLILSGGTSEQLSPEEQKSEETAYRLARVIADEIRRDEHFHAERSRTPRRADFSGSGIHSQSTPTQGAGCTCDSHGRHILKMRCLPDSSCTSMKTT